MYKKRQHICHFVIYSGAKVQLFFDICKGWGQKKIAEKLAYVQFLLYICRLNCRRKRIYVSYMYRISIVYVSYLDVDQ